MTYADHRDTAALKARYAADPNVDGAAIVPVSYVADGRPLAEVVGGRHFDYVLASHVLEHIPNPIRWLKEVAAVLEEEGVLSLAIPDKRYSVDCRRENTRAADWLAAYYDDRQRPSFAEVVDHAIETTVVNPAALWRDPTTVLPPLLPDLIAQLNEESLRRYHRDMTGGVDFDVHCHVYTPTSFFRIIRRLIEFGMFDYQVAAFFPTHPGELEFFVSLQRLPSHLPPAERENAQLTSLPPVSAHDHAGPVNAAAGRGVRAVAQQLLLALRGRSRRSDQGRA